MKAHERMRSKNKKDGLQKEEMVRLNYGSKLEENKKELPGIVKWADLISVKRNRVAFAVAVIGGIGCDLNGRDCDPEKGEDQRVLHAPIRKSPGR